MTTFNIRDYALPDAEPKRARGRRTALVAVVLALGVGLALGLGFGVGLGGDFALVGAFGTKRVLAAMASPERLSANEWFRRCSMSEYDDAPDAAELDAMLARRQGRYAEPKWPAP